MAGIEKICELTGEYPGWPMYGYKRNQLQIMPIVRPQFRGDGDTIYVELEGLRWEYKWGGTSTFNKEEMNWYEPPFQCEREFIQYKRNIDKLRLLKEYKFAYITRTPALQGEVDGVYINWTNDISAMKRKMKRLLRCKKLNIVFVNNLYDDVLSKLELKKAS